MGSVRYAVVSTLEWNAELQALGVRPVYGVGGSYRPVKPNVFIGHALRGAQREPGRGGYVTDGVQTVHRIDHLDQTVRARSMLINRGYLPFQPFRQHRARTLKPHREWAVRPECGPCLRGEIARVDFKETVTERGRGANECVRSGRLEHCRDGPAGTAQHFSRNRSGWTDDDRSAGFNDEVAGAERNDHLLIGRVG